MAMEVSSNYGGYYANGYDAAGSRKRTSGESTNKRHYGQEMTADANKITEKRKPEAKADTGREDGLLSQLQKKYSGFDITAGTFSRNQISSQSRGFQGVIISPAYLAKAENSEKTAKELDEMLSGVESAQKWLEDAFRRDGLELVSCGYFINENGEMGSWSLVKKKDSMFDGLAEQGTKSADRLKEKQEKAQEQKKTDEKKAEKREAEGQREKQIESPGNRLLVVASSKEELLEKARAAANGVNEKRLAKEERASGNRVDYSI